MWLVSSPRRSRLFAATFAIALSSSVACSDHPSGPSAEPQSAFIPSAQGTDVRAAIAAQERHTPRLMSMPGVVGTAVGLNPAGKAVVKVFTAAEGIGGIPGSVDGVAVAIEVTGRFFALSDPTSRQRPAPLGFSVGHPNITAGTIGARVKDASGKVYVLSNNHVLANSNAAQTGDNALQPGPYDGGQDPADRIADLSAFKVINFNGGDNKMDAAIAISTTAELGNATPTDDGYGMPSSIIYGDADKNGTFDNTGQLLGLAVQKYGRTTKLTKGSISEINVTVTVCYEGFAIFCTKSATFSEQVAIGSSSFSDGGDSGSLIVTDDVGKNPVGLLFAGSSSRTLANRIDLVLNEFNVTVDGSTAEPPPPPPPGTMHVGDLDGSGRRQGSTWTAAVSITMHDGAHAPLANATVSGSWSSGASGSATCTTGTNGTCAVQVRKLSSSSATFSVTGASHGSHTYDGSANHDPESDSDGSSITVTRP